VQVVVVRPGLQVERLPEGQDGEDGGGGPAEAEASGMVFRCRISADAALARGSPVDEALRKLEECLEKRTADALIAKSEELRFQTELRKRLSDAAENHTCSDPDLATSDPVRETTWTHRGVARRVGVLHDRPSSQIHVVRGFISLEECDAVRKAAEPSLHRGTVADGKGGSRMSEHRKGASDSRSWANALPALVLFILLTTPFRFRFHRRAQPGRRASRWTGPRRPRGIPLPPSAAASSTTRTTSRATACGSTGRRTS
jgi:hypothetical protein